MMLNEDMTRFPGNLRCDGEVDTGLAVSFEGRRRRLGVSQLTEDLAVVDGLLSETAQALILRAHGIASVGENWLETHVRSHNAFACARGLRAEMRFVVRAHFAYANL